MIFPASAFLYILTEAVASTSGLDCYQYTPFTVRSSSEHSLILRQTISSITTKSCKDDELCSRLHITDATNETYTALDCLDRSVCENSESWCRSFTTNGLFTSCEAACCDGNLCAELNKTKPLVKTKISNIQRVSCSIFTPFRVIIESKEVVEIYSPMKTTICELDEMCGGVILTDKNNRTHQASACVSHHHCKNPDTFCEALTLGSNGTFVHCELKCCAESFCLDNHTAYETSPKCFEYKSFSLADDEVKISHDTNARTKTCNEDEVCSKGSFTDRMNNTHISLDCLPKTVCDNPNKLCEYFTESNQQSPFVRCDVECCLGNLCYSESILQSSQTPSLLVSKTQPSKTTTSETDPSNVQPSATPTSKTQPQRTQSPTVAKPSGGTKVQTGIKTILSLTILYHTCLGVLMH